MPRLLQFGGIIPRYPDHLLPEGAATIAHNVKLIRGVIDSWRNPLTIQQAPAEDVALKIIGCNYFTFPTCVSIAEYLPDYNRHFITGRNTRPEVMEINDGHAAYYFLGVPSPKRPPTVTGAEATGMDCAVRSYVYTYVNTYGEESAPSPPSMELSIQDGSAVSISDFEPPPTGWQIESISIYRTETAYRTGAEKSQEPMTAYFQVASIPVGQLTYIDQVLILGLGRVLDTEEVRVPPADLRQIALVEGTGTLTGVTANQIHFSQNLQPYNWPAEFGLTLPHNIVNMRTVGSKVIVTTDSTPFIIDGNGSCEARQCRAVGDVGTILPDIGCGYANSAIAVPFGMIYSSKDGLVLVSPEGTYQIITSAWFSSDDWRKIRPDTVRLAYWRGFLFCITDVVSFVLEVDAGTYNDYKAASLTTISDKPIDLVVSSNGELHFFEEGNIRQWDAGISKRPYYWESAFLDFSGETSPTSIVVETQGTKVSLIADKFQSIFSRYIATNDAVRLKRLGRHLSYKIRFEGVRPVEYALLGTAHITVNQGG